MNIPNFTATRNIPRHCRRNARFAIWWSSIALAIGIFFLKIRPFSRAHVQTSTLPLPVAKTTPPRFENVRIIPRGVVQRIHIDGSHGPFGFYIRAENICTQSLDLYLGPLVYYDDRPDAKYRLSKSMPLLWPFGSVNEHRPTRFGFSFQSIKPLSKPIRVPDECYFKGSTVVIENSAGAPGHIGHFAETVSKFFAWVDQYIGGQNVDMVWATGLSKFPATDWEHHYAAAAVGLSGKHEALPAVLDTTLANEHAKRYNCTRLCFEDTYWSQVVQQWQMSRKNADQIRSRAWAYCGIAPRDVKTLYRQTGYMPTFVFLPRFKTRIVVNQEDVLQWAKEEGFLVQTPVKNLTDFCAQVALMESADVLFR